VKWQARASSDDARLIALDAPGSLDWVDVDLPQEWAHVDGLGAGPVLVRSRFATPVVRDDERLWVEVAGVADQADLWLDGAYLGDQDGYFVRHGYDITALASLADEHELLLETTGGEHAGVWRPISLRTTGPARIGSLRVLTRDATEENAHVLLTAEVDSSRTLTCEVVTRLDGTVVDTARRSLARGVNTVTWSIDVANPALWWPWLLGAQNLTEVEVEVRIDGTASDTHGVRTGLRQVSFQNWVCTVNGERLFLDGAWVPRPPLDLATAGDDEVAAPVRTARERGLDLLRVHAHVAHPAFYAAADELGILLLQDLPVRGSGRRGRKVAARWTAGVVNAVGHHPSVLAWHHRALDQFTRRGLAVADPTRDAVGHLSTLLPPATRSKVGAWLGTIDAVTRTPPEASVRLVPNLARFVTHEELELVPPLRPDNALERDGLVAFLRSIGFDPTTGYCFERL
jgi:beta-mannosidase